jgi:hypothetical protein
VNKNLNGVDGSTDYTGFHRLIRILSYEYPNQSVKIRVIRTSINPIYPEFMDTKK